MKLSDGSRNNYTLDSSQLSTLVYSQLILRMYPATNGLDGGAWTDLFPGARNRA